MKARLSLFAAPGHQVLAHLASLIERDRCNQVEILRVLDMVDRRKLYRPHPSLYHYCRKVLKLSEYEAYMRILAARAARRHPLILEKLETGQLTLTTVRLLAPWLDQKTAADLLPAACGKSKREVQQLLAERFPKPDLPTRIVPELSTAALIIATGPTTAACRDLLGPDPVRTVQPAPAGGPAWVYQEPPPPARVEPIAPQRFALQLTIDGATREKLQHAQELLSHVVDAGDVATVIDRALDALIEQLHKGLIGSSTTPRPHAANSGSDHIPLGEQAKVIARDGWKCSFPMPDGAACGSCWRLQFHHVVSRAKGGASVASNLKLRCVNHHRMETEAEFGTALVAGKIERARTRSGASVDRGNVPGGLFPTATPSAPPRAAPGRRRA
jgi:hypothetical protein